MPRQKKVKGGGADSCELSKLKGMLMNDELKFELQFLKENLGKDVISLKYKCSVSQTHGKRYLDESYRLLSKHIKNVTEIIYNNYLESHSSVICLTSSKSLK